MPDSQPFFLSELSEDRYRLFIAGVSDYAIYMLTPEGYVDSWNAGAQRFKGYQPSEIIGRHFSVFYTHEDRSVGKPAAALKTALSQGKYEEEGWRVRKDGTRFWASVVIDPIYDTDGRLMGFAKITRDISDRRAAEEALRESEERFRLLVQSVIDYAIYMLSPSGRVTNWNAGAERIKGYSAEEVVGSHFSCFYTEEERLAGMPERALKIAAEEGRYESEGWRIRKDGTRFWANAVIDSIRNRDGKLIGFAKITRDITEKKEADEALKLTQEALFQSQKLEALGKLTGGIAHDFNNLLAVIVSGLDLFASKPQDPTEAKVFESMRRAADRGATLIQQLLSFARQQPLSREKYDLNRVISSFEAVLRRACPSSVDFELHLSPGLNPVLVDATQFETALLNLVTNGRDAMPNGGTLCIQTENVRLANREVGSLSAGDYVQIVVKDSGRGMPVEVAARAVEPFFTTKDVGKGTGMGLSQVYGLVQQSGGDMRIESKEGSGSSIFLYFAALTSQEDIDAAASTSSEVRKDKALVVDDQADVLEVAVELFRSMGYEVLSASNGNDAVEILKREPDVDVLFTDITMPGINGIELGREARRLTPEIKVVLVSGYPMPALSAENNDLENFAFIKKPYRVSEIMRMLRTPG